MAIYFDNSNITTGSKGEAGYTPIRGTDYWTDIDIAEIKGYVDEAANEALDNLNIDGNTTTTLNGILKGNGSIVSAAEVGEDYASPALPQTVTLTTTGWDAETLTQTISVNGATATNVKIVAPNEANVDEYATYGVKATGEGNGTVTFTCTTVPEADLSVNIAILG